MLGKRGTVCGLIWYNMNIHVRCVGDQLFCQCRFSKKRTARDGASADDDF